MAKLISLKLGVIKRLYISATQWSCLILHVFKGHPQGNSQRGPISRSMKRFYENTVNNVVLNRGVKTREAKASDIKEPSHNENGM